MAKKTSKVDDSIKEAWRLALAGDAKPAVCLLEVPLRAFHTNPPQQRTTE